MITFIATLVAIISILFAITFYQDAVELRRQLHTVHQISDNWRKYFFDAERRLEEIKKEKPTTNGWRIIDGGKV